MSPAVDRSEGENRGQGEKGRTADFDGGLEFKENGLGDEDFARFCAEMLNFVLLELYGLARSISAHCLKIVKNRVSRVNDVKLSTKQHHGGVFIFFKTKG
jgi:hypothetical protein